MSREIKLSAARITDASVIAKWRNICEQLKFSTPVNIRVRPIVENASIHDDENTKSLNEGPLKDVLDVNGIGIKTFYLPVSPYITIC